MNNSASYFKELGILVRTYCWINKPWNERFWLFYMLNTTCNLFRLEPFYNTNMLPFNILFMKKLDVWKSVYFCPKRTKHVINELYITHISPWDNWAIIITTFTWNHKHLTTSYTDTTDFKIIIDRYMFFPQHSFTLESTGKWQKISVELAGNV